MFLLAALAAPAAGGQETAARESARTVASGETDRDAGDRLFTARRYEEARPRLAAAFRADARDARSALQLGKIALVDGNGDDAARWLERAVAAGPGDADAHRWLGRAYARQASHAGRIAQLKLAGRIRGAFERAVALDPNDPEARLDLMRYYLVAPGFAGGGTDKAKGQARAIAKLSAWRGHLAAGALAEKAKDAARAEREYRLAIAAAPDSVDAYVALAAMYERRQQWAPALALYESLLARDAGRLVGHYYVGRIGSLSGADLPRAAASLERYVAAAPAPGDPSRASAWYRLGLVYEQQGDRARARQALARTLALDPRQDDARAALGRVR